VGNIESEILDIHGGLIGEWANLRMGLFQSGNLDGTSRWENGQVNDWIRIVGTKLWYDGSPYTGSMYMCKDSTPFEEDQPQQYIDGWLSQQLGIPQGFPPKCGRRTYKDKLLEFKQAALQYLEGDGILAVHTQGSAAGKDMLKIFEEYGQCGADPDSVKCRLEHNGFLALSDVYDAHRLGVHLSFHPLHIYWYGDDLNKLLNRPARKSIMPIGTAVRHNMKVSLHNDSPMYPPNPLLAVRTAVTRKTFKDDNKHIKLYESVRVKKALKAVTIDAAHALNFDHIVGSLKEGKKADIVILDKDPMAIAPENLHKIRVERLFVAGKQVFDCR
jgi:Amidohydrolase family